MSICLTTFDAPGYTARHARYGPRPASPRHARRRSRVASALSMASWAPLGLAIGFALSWARL